MERLEHSGRTRRSRDFVDAIRIEGDVAPDLRPCFKWGLIGPDDVVKPNRPGSIFRAVAGGWVLDESLSTL